MGLDFNNVIEANKIQFEFIILEKNKLIKKITSTKYLLILLIFLFSVFRLLPQLLEDNSLIFSIVTVGILVSILTILVVFTKNDQFLSTKSKNAFYGTFKGKLIFNVILTISDKLVYKPINRIQNKIIKESNLFETNISDFLGGNLIQGDINDMTINMSELTLLKGLKREFHGLFVYVKNISEENPSQATLNSLTDKWTIKGDSLYMAIPRRDKLFNLKLVESNKSIEKVKSDIVELINIFQVISDLTGMQFESNHIPTPVSEDALDDIFDKKSFYFNSETKQKFALAASSKRILNLIIDQIIILVLSSILFYLLGLNSAIVFLLVLLIIDLSYYLVLETVSSQTVGKMITKSKVVTITGEKPRFLTIGLRTVCRFIPFEQYSFINSNVGLHDKLSSTITIEV